jgi:anti-sigma B factor antagonist
LRFLILSGWLRSGLLSSRSLAKSKIDDQKQKFEIGESSIMAELNIRERQAGDITVLDMDGRITIGEGSVALRSAVRRLLEEGKKNILLNLAGVGYIDSSGIGELVSSYTAINKEGGQLKLLSLTQKLQDLLTITKLLTVFDAYDTEADALSNFK